MVYGKRRYNSYRKNYRNRRTLSTRNIFNNKSSRAQAYQISSLRKRINYVYKQCKPEVKIVESPNPLTLTLAYSTPGLLPYFLYKITMPELGVNDNERIGNACNILDSHIFLNMKIAYSGDVSYQLNGLGQTVNSTVRIVPFLVKAPSDQQPDGDDILPIASSFNEPNYRMNPIAPFNEGVSAKYQILGDYRYTLRMDDKSLINTKLRIKGSRIKKYIDTQYNTIGKAAIYLLITWNGLEPLTFQTETIATPVAYLTISDKTAYTDP